MTECKVCGRKTSNPTWCSKECVDISEGEAPRRTGNPDSHYIDSPHKKESPGSDYTSNEERRVYNL